MDIPRRKSRLNLPYDCHKLSAEDCENPKFENKCVIKTTFWGGKEKCVPNETYLIDKEISDKGFKDFTKLDEENLEEDIVRRDELCRALSPTACRSSKAKIFGCEYKRGFFKQGRCKLADKIINYYYNKSKKCLCKNCNEEKEKGFKLCQEHRYEFNEIVEAITKLYKDIMEGKDIEKNYESFINLYNDLVDRYNVYLFENTGTLIQLTEKYNEIRRKLGEDYCQCVNIKTCIGKGDVGQFCRNKGIRTKLGLLCEEHKKCFLDRKKKFDIFKENFQKLCNLRSCKKELEELENFYRMVLFCSEGESFVYKNTLLDYLFIIRQYIKEVS